MGEGKKDISQLRGVHHLLTQHKSDEAQALLARMAENAPDVPGERMYLQAWQAAVQEQWEIVAQQVRDMPVFLETEEREQLLTHGSARRRRPMCLLMLGAMARELGYPEEAIEHIQHGLSLLNERRMNIPEVRWLAYMSLGRLALEMNQTSQALLQYETARTLCHDENPESPLYAEILAGLCEAQARQEHFEQALATGKQALALLQADADTSLQEHLLALLSQISLALNDYAAAQSYALNARSAAARGNDPLNLAQALLGLAEVQKHGCSLQEARANCTEALTLLKTAPAQHLKGNALFLLGKIAEAEWQQHPHQEQAASEAQAHYEQAQALFQELHDTAALARVSTCLARLLEAKGEPALALTHWKQAFILTEQRG